LSILGVALTEATNAGFLLKLTTVTTILLAWLILKEKISLTKLSVMSTMLLGAYLLTTRGQSLLPRMGDLIILGACLSWSLGDVLVREIMSRESVSANVVTIQKPLANLPVYLILGGMVLLVTQLTEKTWDVLQCCQFPAAHLPYPLVSGIFLALSWVFLYRTLQIATASFQTLMSMLTPVLVAVLAMTFLDERLVFIQIIGAGLIILSGVLTYFSDIVRV
jgi:drug/metabolite transporter (DMT)-like permease